MTPCRNTSWRWKCIAPKRPWSGPGPAPKSCNWRNSAPAAVAACRDLLASHELRPILAAAGGIHPGNAAAYAASGARLLVSSWPYSAMFWDVAVSLVPV